MIYDSLGQIFKRNKFYMKASLLPDKTPVSVFEREL